MPSPLTRANSCIAAGADVGQEDVLLSPRGREKLEQPTWLDPEATAASIDEHVADIRTRLDKEEGRTEGLDSTGKKVGVAALEDKIIYDWHDYLVVCMDFYLALGARSMHAKFSGAFSAQHPSSGSRRIDRCVRVLAVLMSESGDTDDGSHESKVWQELQAMDELKGQHEATRAAEAAKETPMKICWRSKSPGGGPGEHAIG